MKLKATLMLAASLVLAAGANATDLVIATVNNGHMIEMQKLGKHFETANPDIKLKWVTLEEGVLRQRVTTDIATKGGQFDVMTIGMYETPIWGKKGWLQELKPDAAYDVDDLLPAMRQGLSVDNKLYPAPYNAGKWGMWMDATIAAWFVSDPAQGRVADKGVFAQAPTAVTPKGANWLWAWALAIPAGSKHTDAAQKFIAWATSKEYIKLVAQEKGWASVPTGTRNSTYTTPEFLQAAKLSLAEKKAVHTENTNRSKLPQ